MSSPRFTFVALALTVALSPALEASELAEELERTERTYELERAVELAQRAEGTVLAPRAHLLVAELYRIDFESMPEDERNERRALGVRIDEAAELGLAALDGDPELSASSQGHRLRADLLATLIRSRYRGQKYRRRMESAAQRALELDPTNARAWVSLSKPLLFAPGREPEDVKLAVEHLEVALGHDSRLEPARLLRARALLELDEREAAQEELERVLASNPASRPARDLLARIEE